MDGSSKHKWRSSKMRTINRGNFFHDILNLEGFRVNLPNEVKTWSKIASGLRIQKYPSAGTKEHAGPLGDTAAHNVRTMAKSNAIFAYGTKFVNAITGNGAPPLDHFSFHLGVLLHSDTTRTLGNQSTMQRRL